MAGLLLGASLAVMAIFFSANPAQAATVTWAGVNGTTTNWSDALNWSGGTAPVNGDAVILAQTGAYAPSTLDYNLTALSITLNTATDPTTLANGYVITSSGGSILGLQSGGSITDSAVNNAPDQINTGISLNGPATITLSSGATGLVIGGTGITGTGGLTVTNNSSTGLIVFAANNTYTGGTTISAGTLQLGDGTTTGTLLSSSAVSLTSNTATLAFKEPNNLIFSNNISGSGGVSQEGSNTLTLSGANTYTGGTNINAGTLAVSTDANLGSVTGTVAMAPGTTLATTATGTFAHPVTVTGDPIFSVAPGTTTTWSGVISDGTSAGTVEITGGGTFAPTAVNTYSGGTVVRGGSTLSVGADSELGATTGGLTLGDATTSGTLAVSSAFTLSSGRSLTLAAGGGTIDTGTGISFGLSQGITGAGALTVAGPGTLVLTGANTYSGDTTISIGSTLQIGNTTTTGSIATLGVIDSGSLVFDRNNSISFLAPISGPGSVSQIGSGMLTLGTSNSYSGGTTVSGGTLALTGSTSIGTGTLALSNGATVDFLNTATFSNTSTGTLNGTNTFDIPNSQNYITWPGLITDSTGTTGSLTLAGSGTLELSADNTYSGVTTIDSGATLSLGTLAGSSAGSVAGSITNNGTLEFNRTNNVAFSGGISGSGKIWKQQTNTVTLTGNNSSGGGTTIFDGTLQLGDGTTTGTLSSDVSLISTSAKLAFDEPGTGIQTFSNNITGGGGVSQLGNNTLTLTGANNYTGVTTISAGTLQLGNGGANGGLQTMSGAVTDNGTLNIDYSTDLTITGDITGSGGVSQLGNNTLTLTGANNYSGVTTISAASTLQIGAGGNSGSISGDVVNSGTLSFNRSDSAPYSGVISGAGSLSQIGTGTTVLTGANIYTGGTTISAGTLQLGNGTTNGSITGDVTDNGTLAFDPNGTYTFAGVISGSGAVNQVGTGTTTLSGANTYSGATNINAGTLAVSSSGNLGTGAVGFTNGATLQFLANSNYALGTSLGSGGGTFDTNGYNITWSGDISGASGNGLVKTGAGTLILAGANTYTGGTTVSAGTLQLGDGTTTGILSSNVSLNSATTTLAFNNPGNLIFSNNITGTGAVAQNGTGTTTLTGSNTYTGGTNINAGTLAVSTDASLGNVTGTVAMAPGTTLATTATGSFAHPVTVTGDSIFSVASGKTTTWSGVISGTGKVDITGGGTFAPTSANTYSGGTVVRGGSTLSVGADNELGATSVGLTLGDPTTSGTLALTSLSSLSSGRSLTLAAGGGTIDIGTGISFGISQGISGTGALTVAGPGTLVLTGTTINTYSGGTTVSLGGILQLGDGTNAGMITGAIADNGALVFEEGANTTFSGAISGSGTLTQNDSGHTLTLIGANTYTGGTTISAGTLQIGNGGATGSISGNITDNGALAFDRSGALTLTGAISGTGSLSQIGGGTTILTGANTYNGGTTISTGTLQIGNGGTSGSLTGDVADAANLAFDRSDSATYSGVISGTGALSQIGTGTTVLTGANTYSGGTNINAGTLSVSSDINLGNINGTVAMSAGSTLEVTANGSFGHAVTLTGDPTFNIASGTTTTWTNVISDGASPGTLNLTGGGTLILTATNTYTGGTTISAGTLQLGNGGATGSITGNVVDNGTLAFDRSNALTFTGAISGTGSLSQIGTGTTVLTGANAYNGGTTISAGTLQIGNGGTSGSITGDVADAANLAFDRTNALTYTGVISGTGSLSQIGIGTTTLSGANNYSGGTTISAGTLQIGDGGTTGSIVGNVTDNATLAFDRSNALTYTGVISGLGNVIQIGTGTTTLTGANTYTGATTVEGGTLLDNGSLAFSSGVTVNSGATFGGTGTVSNLTVGNRGTVAPGGSGSIGTLNVNGNLLLSPSSVYAFDATSSSSDLLQVSGNARLGGTVKASLSGTGFGSKPIPLLTASGGVTGTFSNVSVVAGAPSNLNAYLSYNANNAYLVFMPSIVSLVPSSGSNSNQGRVASAIDFASQHDNAGMTFQPLTALSAADLSRTLSQMTGETATGVQTVALGTVDTFLGSMLNPSVGGRGGLSGGYAIAAVQREHIEQLAFNGPASLAPYEQPSTHRFSVWGGVLGGDSESDGNTLSGTNRLTANHTGVEVGVNSTLYRGKGAIGLAVGYDKGDWKLAQSLGTGSAKAVEAGIYYSRQFWQNYFAASFSYAHYDVSTERTLNYGGVNDYRGSFMASSLAGRLEGGHTFRVGANLLTPYVRFQGIDLSLPNHKETTLFGSPSFALSYTSKKLFDYSSELGGTWSRAWNWPSGSRTAMYARLGWLHNYIPNSGNIDNTVTFSAFSGASFLVQGAGQPKDAAHFKFGVDHSMGNILLALNAQGEVARTAHSFGGLLSVSYGW